MVLNITGFCSCSFISYILASIVVSCSRIRTDQCAYEVQPCSVQSTPHLPPRAFQQFRDNLASLRPDIVRGSLSFLCGSWRQNAFLMNITSYLNVLRTGYIFLKIPPLGSNNIPVYAWPTVCVLILNMLPARPPVRLHLRACPLRICRKERERQQKR